MSGISDITKLLEQIPIWRALKALPGRVEALEARVAELEQTLAKPKVTPGQPCPACGHHALRRTASEISSGHFGALGARDEVWTCENCGEEDRRSGVR